MKTHAVPQHAVVFAHAPRPIGARAMRFVLDRFLLLPLGAAIALVWANTTAESYFRVAQALSFPVNEIAMALFLALVAQDVVDAAMPGGALHTWRRWGTAVIAAFGGVAGAAGAYLLYVGVAHESVLRGAWPMACAVDVAAAYYVLVIVWRRGPALPFALLLALATDAIALAVIVFRPHAVAPHPGGSVLVVAAMAVAALLRARHVRTFLPYIVVCGPLAWWGLYLEGLHPALALVPIVPFLPHRPRPIALFADADSPDSVVHGEHVWNEVAQVTLFFFGLVNAGVILRGYDTGTWAVLAAGLAGRPIGLLLAMGLATALGFHLPRHVGWRGLIVIAIAMSSGFTFALFIATSIVPMGPALAQIKLGALATAVAALLALAAARLLRVGRFAR